ncbi:hypothetical protein ANCDUO_09944 [Ancylostoma duodenale]|uniref:Uncharacterized protein n=1 Tax=Ancylostoma duodenale TaxID=51022 RepID=A0A0C2GS47_9BILA|nr:hypothetical protein ANCDUO_09944 [Ancylostoma duodenale]
MGAKEEAKDLIAQRDKLDMEIEQNFEILKKEHCRNDRKALTEKIEKAIQKSHAEQKEMKGSGSDKDARASDEPVPLEYREAAAGKEEQAAKVIL